MWIVEQTWAREIAVAVEAARKAAELALRYQPNVVAETKPDNSPVTAADRECERLIASMLSEAFPEDGLLGEEGTKAESRSGRRWIIDPIDGTRDYVRGNPLWANLIALEQGDEVVVGVVNLPMLGNLYSAGHGGGALLNGSPICVSSKSSINEAVLCMSAFDKLEGTPLKSRMLDWMARFWAVRGLGGATDAMMVASGQAEIWIEPHASPWDFAPLKVIVEEAGGRFLNFDGGSSIYAGNCVLCAPAFEQEVRRFLGLNS
ncbi:MAG TPA: inositol monophosphatase family protein [Bryobacteraceae bacterium]|nr:inositol monophosphatase family protein [Bryobacteraceae bacterium]